MSGFLAGKVWHSALDPNLKPLAATLADLGGDDGSSIYPSVSYICWRLGKAETTVRDGLRELRKLGVLKVLKAGGGKFPTVYQLEEDNLPKRPTWKESRKGVRAGFLMVDFMAEETDPPPVHRETPLRPTGRGPTGTPRDPLPVHRTLDVKEPLENPSSNGYSFPEFRRTFSGRMGVSVSNSKSVQAKFEGVLKDIGGEKLRGVHLAWMDAAQYRYRDKTEIKRWAVKNFFDDVYDFELPEPEKKKSYPKAIP